MPSQSRALLICAAICVAAAPVKVPRMCKPVPARYVKPSGNAAASVMARNWWNAAVCAQCRSGMAMRPSPECRDEFTHQYDEREALNARGSRFNRVCEPLDPELKPVDADLVVVALLSSLPANTAALYGPGPQREALDSHQPTFIAMGCSTAMLPATRWRLYSRISGTCGTRFHKSGGTTACGIRS